jgi:hypothetical protein
MCVATGGWICLKVLHLQHMGEAPTKGRNRTAWRLKISAGAPFSVYFRQLFANAAIAAIAASGVGA